MVVVVVAVVFVLLLLPLPFPFPLPLPPKPKPALPRMTAWTRSLRDSSAGALGSGAARTAASLARRTASVAFFFHLCYERGLRV